MPVVAFTYSVQVTHDSGAKRAKKHCAPPVSRAFIHVDYSILTYVAVAIFLLMLLCIFNIKYSDIIF